MVKKAIKTNRSYLNIWCAFLYSM